VGGRSALTQHLRLTGIQTVCARNSRQPKKVHSECMGGKEGGESHSGSVGAGVGAGAGVGCRGAEKVRLFETGGSEFFESG
jgi:hypothetical protein